MSYTIDEDLCTLCQCCESQCPVNAIAINSSVKVDPNSCIDCDICTTDCPTGAIHPE